MCSNAFGDAISPQWPTVGDFSKNLSCQLKSSGCSPSLCRSRTSWVFQVFLHSFGNHVSACRGIWLLSVQCTWPSHCNRLSSWEWLRSCHSCSPSSRCWFVSHLFQTYAFFQDRPKLHIFFNTIRLFFPIVSPVFWVLWSLSLCSIFVQLLSVIFTFNMTKLAESAFPNHQTDVMCELVSLPNLW